MATAACAIENGALDAAGAIEGAHPAGQIAVFRGHGRGAAFAQMSPDLTV